MVSASLRERYLRDPLPIRLGGLAADLARIATCAGDDRDHAVVASLLEEAEYFSEWAAPDAPHDVQVTLAELQVQLAVWRRRWTTGRREPAIGPESEQWS